MGLSRNIVFTNANIITMNPARPVAEALFIVCPRIQAIGYRRDIEKMAFSDDLVIDLKGNTVLPGFIDTHCHPSLGGTGLIYEVVVYDATSIEEIVSLLRRKALETPPGEWIIGRRYDEQRLKEKRHPTKWELDQASTDHPIFLKRVDAHLGVANRRAMHMTGYHEGSAQPAGGKFDRDPATGEPNGVLRDGAQAAIQKRIPEYRMDQIKLGIGAALREFAGFGMTSLNDAIVTRDAMVAYQELLDEGALPLRCGLLPTWLYSKEFPPYGRSLKEVGIKAGFGNDLLRIAGTKFAVDGSLSGETAALHQPYSNDHSNCGLLLHSRDSLLKSIVESHKAGLRPCVHAIGDRSIDLALDAFEAANHAAPVPGSRLRLEHCILPSEKALSRMKALGVVPSSSIGFLYELGGKHMEALGSKRMIRYLPHKTYLNKGMIAAGNSDWSVTSGNIFQHMYGAVTRKTSCGHILNRNESITIEEALKLFTVNAAYAEYQENLKGTLESGKLADLVIVDRNPLSISADELMDVQVLKTIVGGKTVFERKSN